MFDPLLVLGVVVGYMGFLFLVGLWAEAGARAGKNIGDNGVIYALSLAVYCTSWTYYGSVGIAATSGPLFLTVYLGPTLAVLVWDRVLGRMLAIKNSYQVTDIADFISLRYDKSQAVAALTTVIGLLIVTPYIGLQFKAVGSTFRLLTQTAYPGNPGLEAHAGLVIAVLMIVFTIVLGIRRINPTGRHQGVVLAMAVESLVKLLALLAVGIFVTYGLYQGWDDLIGKALKERLAMLNPTVIPAPLTWTTYTILSASAIFFLPRQFHLAVVENFRISHLRTAVWLFPLYLVVINIFVAPMTLAGLLTGHPSSEADTFVLRLPLAAGARTLTLIVFLGGFSAATSMVMVETLALSNMIANHLLMPLIAYFPPLSFLRRQVLKLRWLAATGGILIGYLFAETVSAPYLLFRIGTVSFAAALQLAPATLGGLFWTRGSKTGALLGLSSGSLVWFHTMLWPTLVRAGALAGDIIEGPWGLNFLAPEAFFGIKGLDPVTHSVFWSLLVNISLYILGSLFFPGTEREQRLAREFVGAPTWETVTGPSNRQVARIVVEGKKLLLNRVLAQYFPAGVALKIVDESISRLGLDGRSRISIAELAELNAAVETSLAGSIGAAAAQGALRQSGVFTADESHALSEYYSGLLATMRVPPEELRRRIDYYQEREALLHRQARELAEEVRSREKEIIRRQQVEEALRESETRYRLTWETAPDALTITRIADGRFLDVNEGFSRLFGYSRQEVIGRTPFELMMFVNPDEWGRLVDVLRDRGEVRSFELQYQARDGPRIDGLVSARPIGIAGEECLIGVIADITELKRALTRVRESEEKFRNLFESAPDGIAITTKDGFLLAANETFIEMFGVVPGEGPDLFNVKKLYVHPDVDRARLLNELWRMGDVKNQIQELFDHHGRIIIASVSARLIQYEGQTRILSLIRDITELKRLEAQLRDYAENLERMVDDKTGELKATNDELSATVRSLEETRAQLALSAHQAGRAELAVSVLHNIGNALNSVNVRASRLEETLGVEQVRSLLLIHDLMIAEGDSGPDGETGPVRRTKMMNLLSVVIKIAQERMGKFEDDMFFMKKALDHVMEIIAIQQRYAGLRGFETKVDLNDLLRDSEEMLQDSIAARGIETAHELADLPELFLDKNKMVQIFINLLKNAFEAIDMAPADRPKKITIETGVEKRGEKDYVLIGISDTGVGLAPELTGEVFRFSFSTKGRGTGFGLHDSANYVKAKGGWIDFSSDGPGTGARVTVGLPITPGEPS